MHVRLCVCSVSYSEAGYFTPLTQHILHIFTDGNKYQKYSPDVLSVKLS